MSASVSLPQSAPISQIYSLSETAQKHAKFLTVGTQVFAVLNYVAAATSCITLVGIPQGLIQIVLGIFLMRSAKAMGRFGEGGAREDIEAYLKHQYHFFIGILICMAIGMAFVALTMLLYVLMIVGMAGLVMS